MSKFTIRTKNIQAISSTYNTWFLFTRQFGFTFIHPQYLARRDMLWFLKQSRKFATGKLIDLGCGIKPYKKYYPEAQSYLGMDFPSTAWKYESDDKPEIFGDILDLPIKDGYFDTVLLFEVLEHLDNPQNAIKEINRILKPGGTLLFTVPFLYQLHEIPFDYLRYTSYYLEKLFKTNGFEILNLFSIGSFASFWIQALISYCLIKFRENKLYLVALPVFVPFYLSANLFFWLFYPANPNKSPHPFPSGYFVIAKKS